MYIRDSLTFVGIMGKICSQCKKENCEFGKASKEKDGLKSACKNCLREKSREYAKNRRLTNKDILNEKLKQWRKNKVLNDPNYYKNIYYKDHQQSLKRANDFYIANTEKCLRLNKKWRQNNPEKAKQSNKNWRLNNPERVKELQRIGSENYRARKFNAIIQHFTADELNQRMFVFGFKCAYCNGKFEHIDHLIPLSKGGKHCLANLRPSCKKCNNKKFNKNAKAWLKEMELI